MVKKLNSLNAFPIGVFDSGIGGLTVVKEIVRELPNESIIYLGDTARVPYGTRSGGVVTKFALELARFLLAKKVKALVVACNTISANSLEAIKKISFVPVIDVISPTLEAAQQSRGQMGVIATTSTINSMAYSSSIASIARACPLFVPLAEEGMSDGVAVGEIARGYLSDLKKAKIDTLILGCTHYPLLYRVIAKTIGNKIKFYITGASERVAKAAERFFGQKLPGQIVRIDL